jgi:hypothetical protein
MSGNKYICNDSNTVIQQSEVLNKPFQQLINNELQ